TDVEAFFYTELFLNVFYGCLAYIDGFCGVSHLFGEFEAKFIDVRDHNVPCAGVFRDRCGHYADRPGARDQNVFAENLEGKRGMHRVAERIEYRGDIRVDVRFVLPDIRHRHSDIFGKTAVRIYADAFRVRAKISPARHTVPAASANKMAFAAYDVADREIDDVAADLNDLAGEFVADDGRDRDRFLRPRVPIVNVQVSSADAAAFYADHHVIYAKRRLRDVLDPEAGFCFALYDCFHLCDL